MEIKSYLLNWIKHQSSSSPVISGLNAKLDTTGINDTSNSSRISPLIRTVDITDIDFSHMSSIAHLFYGCYNLSEITGLDFLVSTNISNISYVLDNCSSLTNLDDVSYWNVKNVTNFRNCFNTCSGYSGSLDLTTWNTKKGMNFNTMFSGCSGLTEIIFGSNFSLEGIGYANGLDNFVKNCDNLNSNTLNAILGLLLTLPQGFLGTKTLKNIGFSSSQCTTAITLSNWSDCVSAGWSTGY